MGVKKETQKEKIERLEKELDEKKRLIEVLIEQITDKDDILKSKEKLITTQREYIEILKANEDKSIKKHNERGAGRKQSFTEEEKGSIEMYRVQGKTIKEIANLFKCSTRTINRVLAERKLIGRT